MLHTIKEAIALTGKSRRTIYNHCDEGRVSYSVGPDGRRYFDTSELIRAYGPLHGVAHFEQPEAAQVCTPPVAHPDAPLTEATALRLIAAIERLVEVEERKLLLLEHRPQEGLQEGATASSAPSAVQPASESRQHQPVQSFADLLEGLD